MNKNIYNLMNWPDIEGIVYSECDNPKELLGAHKCLEGILIQVFRPDAVEACIIMENNKRYPMEKVDEAGYYAVCIPGRRVVSYQVEIEDIHGKKIVYYDPYQYPTQLTEAFIKKYNNGGCYDVYKNMGAHIKNVNGVKGINFMVWAPEAIRVSVVGDFNNWDGRIYQMTKNNESGIFEIFIPGMDKDIRYKYEIKTHGGTLLIKSDPYSLHYSIEDGYASTVTEDLSYQWKDGEWQTYKENKASLDSKAVAVCELSLADYTDIKASELAKNISRLGFDYVELMPPCEYVNNNTSGYESIGYFAATDRIGMPQDFMNIINELHTNNIGVIMDINFAFMGKDYVGLSGFDGTNLYEIADARLDKHPELNTAEFDYSKPQVRQMLISSAIMWAKQYHIDGFRIDETASMLYLDYGRSPGEWTPNIYGENINLDAIDFIHTLRTVLDKKCPGTLLIAEESSAWPKVTGSIKNECLGFDFKWNYGWKNNFISFMEKDPLFRKGEYGRLTYSMLYNYSESYMLMLSHEEYNDISGSIIDKMPGVKKEDKLANVRLAYGFMYMHPGKKLLNLSQIKEVEEYVRQLNNFYKNNKALYEYDYEPEGFEWVDTSLAQETVMTFVRRDSAGKELFIAVNFTPVVRENYRLGVDGRGKYTEIFNSDSVQFKGQGNVNKDVIKSEKIACNGKDESISIVLPPLAIAVFEYEPYTELELEEIQIRHEAAMAKKKAEEENKIAQELKIKAEEEAKSAQEAARAAQEAAKEAMRAKESAEEKAAIALKTSEQIEEQMKHKLAELKKRSKKVN